VDNEVYSSASIHDGNIFIGSGMYSTGGSPGSVYCFRETDGFEIWSDNNEDGFLSSPLVADGKVFIGSNDEYIYAYNESDGQQLWSFRGTGGGQNAFGSSPSLYSDRIVIGCCNGKVYCFNTPRVNYPPEIELISPEHDTIFRSIDEPLLEWHGSDMNPSDQLTYDVYLSMNENDVQLHRNLARKSEGQSEENYRVTGLEQGQKYYWGIVAADDEYDTESDIWSFTVNTRPTIELEDPGNVSMESSSEVTSSWSGDDQDGDDLLYDVYMDESYDPSTLISQDQTAQDYEMTDLEDGHTYYWTIVVSDGMDEVKSTVFHFTVNFQAATNDPPTVILSSPYDGAILDTTSVALQWGGDDEDEDPITYTVILDTLTDPETIVLENTTAESYDAADLEDGTTYYWKVIASDGIDETASAVLSFSIDLGHVANNPPEIKLVAPQRDIFLYSSSVQLVWTCEDEEDDDLTYDVYLGVSANSTTLIANDVLLKRHQIPGLTFGQTYYWYVTANDGTNEVSSEVRSFTLAKEEEKDDEKEWYEEIGDEPLYLGGISALIIVVILVVAMMTFRGKQYGDYGDENEEWEDEDIW